MVGMYSTVVISVPVRLGAGKGGLMKSGVAVH